VVSVTVVAITPTSAPPIPTPAAADDVSLVRTADPDSVDPATTDCVVCAVHDGWETVVRSLRERDPSLPIVLTGPADPRAGAVASRLGVEYAPTEAFAGSDETLWTRVRALAGEHRSEPVHAGTPTDARRDQRALRDLHRVITDDREDFTARLADLLTIGREYLGVEIGFATHLSEHGTDPTLEVLAVAGDPPFEAGDVFPLEAAYCKRTVDGSGLHVIEDTEAEGWSDDPAFESGLRCYLGGTIEAGGEPYGTVCFASREPRERGFTDPEREYVDLLVQWASTELQRREAVAGVGEARDRFETVLERVGDGFFAVDDNWRFTYLNDHGFKVIQGAAAEPLEQAEIPGRDLWTVVPSAVGSAFERNYRRAMRDQEPVSFEEYFEPLDTWFKVNAYPDDKGLSVFFQDISERRRREEALEELLSTTRDLLGTSGEDAVARAGAQAAADAIDLEFGLVRLHDPERDVLVPGGASDAVREWSDDRPVYDADEGVPGEVFAGGEPVEYDGDETELPDTVTAARVVPLGEHGTLTVGTADREGLTETDRLLVSLLSTTIRTALDRADRIEQLRTYRAIHENVKERIYVLDERGVVQLTTDPLTAELGYEPGDVVGEPVSAFLPDDAVTTGAALLAELRDAHADASRTYETTIVARDGAEIPVEIELSLLPAEEGLPWSVGVVRNRAELQAERARFQSLFDRSPDAIVDARLTEDGPTVRAVNHAFEETFGVDGDSAVGRSVNDLIVPEDDRGSAVELDQQTQAEPTEPVEVERTTPSGPATFLFRGVTYRRSAEDVRAFGIYTDISARKADERRIRMLNRVLRHNLRNAMNVVLGHLDMLELKAAPDLQPNVEEALAAAERVSDLPDKVQVIEEALQADGEATPSADLAPLVAQAAERAREQNPDATVTVDVPAVRVRGGRALETAIEELLENATIHAGEAPVVTATARVEPGTVTLTIDDDGDGIPALEQDVVTGSTDITQLEHSRGLGLWVAYHVVTSLGGRLSFSGPSTVTLELPRAD
jgi:PAS domain S-box-containing protein